MLREPWSERVTYTYASQCDKQFCNVTFPQIEDNTKTYLYEVEPLKVKAPWANAQGTDVWTSNTLPASLAKFDFLRIEVTVAKFVC